EAGAKCQTQCILGQADADGVEVLLGGHVHDLPFDKLDTLIMEEPKIEKAVELLARPKACLGLRKLNRGHGGSPHWTEHVVAEFARIPFVRCRNSGEFRYNVRCRTHCASAITSSWITLRCCSFSRNPRPGFLTLT